MDSIDHRLALSNSGIALPGVIEFTFNLFEFEFAVSPDGKTLCVTGGANLLTPDPCLE